MQSFWSSLYLTNCDLRTNYLVHRNKTRYKGEWCGPRASCFERDLKKNSSNVLSLIYSAIFTTPVSQVMTSFVSSTEFSLTRWSFQKDSSNKCAHVRFLRKACFKHTIWICFCKVIKCKARWTLQYTILRVGMSVTAIYCNLTNKAHKPDRCGNLFNKAYNYTHVL